MTRPFERTRPSVRLFAILWSAGFLGVLSILLLDLGRLAPLLPPREGAQLSAIPPALLKLLSVLQPAIFLTAAVAVGVALASKVALSAPGAQAAARGADVMSAVRPQLLPGLVGGLAGGTLIVLISMATKPFLSPPVAARISEFGDVTPLAMRLLYGGITEELLLRWGFMTLLVWLAWRVFQRGQGEPRRVYLVSAIMISSVGFGVGHLPIAFMLFPDPSVTLIAFVVVANSVFGVIAGSLYWKSGLEAAIVAHMVSHVVMFSASYAGAYF